MTETVFNEDQWDMKDFDWTDKAFYYVPIISIFNKPIGLGAKLEQLYRDARQSGYNILGKMVLVQYGALKSRIMIEVEKKDILDANILHFEDKTSVDTIVYRVTQGGISKAVQRLRERVASKRRIAPREIYYMHIDKPGRDYKTVVFPIT